MGQSSSKPTEKNGVLSVFGGLHKKGLEAHMDAMTDVQKRRVLLHVNKMADSCFRECITDLSFTKYLVSGEQECLNHCVEKYVLLNAMSGNSFGSFLAEEVEFGRR